eukprot:scaffold17.g455.t1
MQFRRGSGGSVRRTAIPSFVVSAGHRLWVTALSLAVGAGQAIPVATGEAEEPQLLERGAASRPKWEAYRANRTVETPGNQWNEKFSSPVMFGIGIGIGNVAGHGHWVSTMLDPWFLWHASQTKTDKVTTHAYHYIYTRYLAHARFSELNVLEIGLGCNMEYGPGASLSIWRSYLPCSNISFLEYDRACAEKFKESIEREAGGRLFIGSQDDPALLADVAQYAKTFGGFDLIVDDGSHKQEHMMASLDALWESVKPGGVYVMEDLTGWWNHDEWVWSTTSPNVNQPHTKHTTAWPIIRQLLDNVNCHCQGGPNWTSFRTWCKAQEGTKWGTVVAFEAMPEAVVLVKGTADGGAALHKQLERLSIENAQLNTRLKALLERMDGNAALAGGADDTDAAERDAAVAATKVELKAMADAAQECPHCPEVLVDAFAMHLCAWGCCGQSGEDGGGGGGGGGSAGSPGSPGREGWELQPLRLDKLLSDQVTLDGILWEPHACFGPWKDAVKDEALRKAVVAKAKAALAEAVGQLAGAAQGKAAAPAPTSEPLEKVLGLRSSSEPQFVTLRRVVSNVMARFLLHSDGSRYCVCGKPAGAGKPISSADDVGTSGCKEGEKEPEDAAKDCMGVGAFPGRLLAGSGTIDSALQELEREGFCASRYGENFGAWWMRERLYHRDYQNFNVGSKDEEAVVELFDILYERHHIFLNQRWLGFTCMQDPFDLLAIQNLIWDVRPDLIIETGTANGGSALLWASLLEVMDMTHTRVHTVDTNDPKTGFGSTDAKNDPTQHKLWTKYVTFHKGMSTEEHVLKAMAAAAQNASTVLVLLDSDHSQHNVAAELEAYCVRFVTPGSYCVVEDTKLSRMSRAGGPLEAVRGFLGKHGDEWEPDRGRELMYSQHVMGYLRRKEKGH